MFVAGALIVGSLRDVPVMDDWVYAWSVEHLLHTGQLQVVGFSSVYPIVQILWGTLVARVAGPSFGVLRLSTVILATAGCMAFYATLREIGIPRGYSLLGALAVALDPVFFALSFSFMTDVPFLSILMIATLLYVQAYQREEPGRLWPAGAVALLAFLNRPLALALPAGAFLCVPWRRQDRWRWAVPIALAPAVMMTAWFSLHHAIGELDMEATRLNTLRWLFLVTPQEYSRWNIGVMFQSVFPLFPLLLPALSRRRAAMAAGVMAFVLAVALRLSLGAIPLPLPDWQTWSLQDIAARAMIGGDATPSAWSHRVMPLVTTAGLLVVASFLLACVSAGRRLSRPAATIVASAAMLVLMINVLWLYNDRYFVIFAPAVATIATLRSVEVKLRPALVVPFLVLLGAVSVTGTLDMLDVNEACETAAHDLEASGVPPWDIDAGYASNGWRLYVHPEHLRVDEDPGEDVPYVTSKAPTTYRVTNTPLPDYTVVRVLPLRHAWWQANDRLYVLRRTGGEVSY